MKLFLLIWILLALGLAKACTYFLSGACNNSIYSEHSSPNNMFKAVVFQRDCGATTGFSTQISILDNEKSLRNEKGNVFIISGHPNHVAPNITWNEDSNVITIHHQLDGKEFLAKNSFGWFDNIKIEYAAHSG